MVITPHLMVGDMNVSRYLVSAHCEITANLEKDAGKFDIKLANPGGIFFGAFGAIGPDDDPETATPTLPAISDTYVEYDKALPPPRTKILFEIINTKKWCYGSSSHTWRICKGEIQHVNVDETTCEISGSCTEGGFSSSLKQHKTYPPGTSVSHIANNLLDDYGVPADKRRIHPKNDIIPDKTPEYWKSVDFDNAFSFLAWQSQSIYFFDENDVFHLCSYFDHKEAIDVNRYVLRGSASKNMVSHYNVIQVFGGSYDPMPADPGSELKTHKLVFAEARDQDEIDSGYGEMIAPPVYVPNCPYEECKQIAANMLAELKQYKDVPQIKIVGMAPSLLSIVTYAPWNGNMPPTRCTGARAGSVQMGNIVGLVTRRVVDLDASGGFVCTLDIATSSAALSSEGIDIDAWYESQLPEA